MREIQEKREFKVLKKRNFSKIERREPKRRAKSFRNVLFSYNRKARALETLIKNQFVKFH